MMQQHIIEAAASVTDTLPRMFSEYLCGLAEAVYAAEEGIEHPQQFVLEPMACAGQMVQAMTHYSNVHPKGVMYQLFGFDPVEATLAVERVEGELTLVETSDKEVSA